MRPIYLGRAPICDVVFQDRAVSNRHLSLWAADGALFAEDLRSRNGTTLDDERVDGVVRVPQGGILRLGNETSLRCLGPASGLGESVAIAQVEDLDAGVRYTLSGDRLVIGGEGADVALPESENARAVVMLHITGEAWLGIDGDDRPLEPEEIFTVGGRRFRIRLPARERAVTLDMAQVQYPYQIEVTLNGPTGPVATVSDSRSGTVVQVTAPNRATLLYLLATRFNEEGGGADPSRGWCTDEELIAGIWGRLLPSNPHNSLNVLVMRTRRELEKAGIDPWFIEKRRGHLRVRVVSVSLD